MSQVVASHETELETAFARMFPLPLTTIESFMFIDARPEYPMMCDLEMQFQGRIERAAFDAALAQAMARAPIFRSLVRPDEQGRLAWVLTEQQPPVDWAAWGESHGVDYDTLIDLTVEPGLRVYVRQGDERSSVLLHFHHACADGIGGFAFIEDFLAAYSSASPGAAAIELRPLDPERLPRRGNPGTDSRSLYRGLADALIGIREGARFFLQRPQPLAAPSNAPVADCPVRQQTGYLSQECPAELSAGLRCAASTLGVSVNDLLIRDLFLALRSWNARHGRVAGRRQLRILMPQNLRERADRRAPATNLLGFAFVTRRASSFEQPEALLASIAEETEAVRKGQLSRYFLGGLAALASAGLLPRVLYGSFCFATAILTNLGDPTRRFVTRFPRTPEGLQIGDLVFTHTTGVPPLRPRTGAAFCVFNNARSLAISLKCDSYRFSQAETQQLLDHYLSQLETTAAGASNLGSPGGPALPGGATG